MKGCILILAAGFSIGVSTAHAKEMYVVDNLKIMVRRLPGEEYKIVAQLPSNEKVEVLRVEDAWAEISLKDGKTGWVQKQYLTEKKPKQFTIVELESKVGKLTARTEELMAKVEALEKENAALNQRNAEAEVAIADQAEKAKMITLENQRLKEKPYRIILLATGGGIFLLGCIMTLIIQRMGRGKRNRLSF